MPIQCTCSYCGALYVSKPSRASGFCQSTCYHAARRARSERTLVDRTWAKVDKNGPVPEYRPDLGPCWVWTGAIGGTGYGHTSLNGNVLQAHRVTWESVKGPIPAGLDIDHLCRNRACCRPSHLEPVTTLVNLQRGHGPTMVAHMAGVCLRGHPMTEANVYVEKDGRRCRTCRLAASQRHRDARPHNEPDYARGARCHQSNLTEDDVRGIRRLFAQATMSNREIARQYGVSPVTIGHIVKRRTWQHIV